MIKLRRPIKVEKNRKALVPLVSRAGLTTEVKALTDRLSEDPSVKKYTFTVNKETGFAKATVGRYDGQTFTHGVVGPGLTETMTYTPNTKRGKAERDQNIVALYERGLTQMEIAERLDVSQSTVSNVLRREGLR